HLCRRLLDGGAEVIGVDSLTTGSESNATDLSALRNFTLVRQDIREPIAISGRVDRVFNMACPASPVDFHEKARGIMLRCSVGVKNLLDLARDKGALFLQASTSECYGDPLVHPQPETYRGNVSTTGPRAPYDEGKRFAEALITTYQRLYHHPIRIV